MNPDFTSYDAYIERYKMFYNEEGDNRPPIMDEPEFNKTFRLLAESYDTYQNLIEMGHMDQAATYYANVINTLENRLAIADASDNFRRQVIDREEM
ncbi:MULTISPECIES: hypothetical protein [Thermoactinomyces]|jgi:hypothetical protein|uniref:Uncharacterized protein n=1 Tax=Thermoactinomyces daqus TaxID=1329516 RepID=A0A7W1X9P5_9BACL|nr:MULTISPECIES: hypothetical protein [Thermoactinomyces]MBA4542606.1 hypothetical protein [Thermoactinomyces daqus]MBH8597415.1 hypothetical protein [Thermoactinomyces sp. CICC 10523]MBH8602976.1 hypothetical protein [Thermoactinomyces sp. CICC 10522]MBH8607176.1 hypothetical protein [Thermoactinomyces sp. CICC 10521]